MFITIKLILGGVVGEVPEKISELLKIAHDNSNRLLLLINDILDMNKIESGRISFSFEKLNLMEVIEKSITDNDAYARQYNVSIIF